MDSLSSTNYKGKVTNRGWSQLPAELIRLIATHYLWDISTTKHCPDTWNIRAFWQCRIVYTVIRDAVEMEKFMQICPQWGLAVEHHNFWDHAVAVIDPRDTLVMHSFVPQQPPNTNTMSKANGGSAAASMAQPKTIKLSPYAHFKQITHWSCIVCRINHPQTNTGLLQARHPFYHTLTGTWGLCREHNGGPDRPSARDRNDRERERERERSTFCGLCLREAQPFDLHIQYGYPYGYGQPGTGMDLEKTRRNPMLYAGCMENEDENTFPGIETTCRACRQEWLMSRIHQTPDYRWYREKVRSPGGKSGLPRLEAWDWDHEARSSVESFIELGEGTVDDIVALVRDRWWLRTRTRLGGMLEQAIAAERFLGGETSLPGTGHRSKGRSMRGADGNLDIDDDIEEDTEEEEEEEEDTELLQLTEDSGVRDLALSDWARRRILDGFWISPADQWYKYFPTPMPGPTPQLKAVHPCPWSLESEEADEDVTFSDDISTDADAEHVPTTHPLPSTIHSPIPPSFHLCEEAYSAFQKEFRTVMLPGMRNIVRRLVIECHAASVEAARLGVPLNPKIADPAIRASKITIEDVVRELRENEGVWWDGWDWIRHGEARNENENDTGMAMSTGTAESDRDSGSCRDHEHEREHGHGRGHGHIREGSDKSSSDESSTPTSTSTLTSPVLSTSTLGTTPSPSPQPQTSPGAGDEKDNHHDKVDSPPSVSLVETGIHMDVERDNVKLQPILVPEVVVKPITIPISPVLDPPRMLRPIPYIPMSIAHLPQFSLDLVKTVWREACAPLYHCRCRICVRAAEKANAAMGGTNQLGSGYQHQQVQQKEKAKDIAWDRKLESNTERSRNCGKENQLVQIRLEEAVDGDVDVDNDEDRDGDGEAETDGTPVQVEYDAEVEEYEYVSEEVEYEDEYDDGEDDDDVRSDVGVVGTRGRYVRDDEDDQEEVDEDAKLRAYRRSRERDRYTRSRSPEIPPTRWDPEPKGTIDLLSSTFSSHETLVASSPRRIPGSRKRSCDEVDGLQGDGAVIGGGGLPSTPPKRARRDSPPSSSLGLGLFPVPAAPASPARKRGSEEVDLESNAEESYERGTGRAYERKHVHIVDACGGEEWKEGDHHGSERRFKRFKTSSSEEEDADTPPRSLTGDSDPEERVFEVKV